MASDANAQSPIMMLNIRSYDPIWSKIAPAPAAPDAAHNVEAGIIDPNIDGKDSLPK